MPIDDVVEVSSRPPAGRRRRLVGIGVVVAVLAAGGGVAAWAATRGGGTSAGAGGGLSCPATVPNGSDVTGNRPVVPATPTASGVDGRLVPTAAPQAVVLCEFGTGGLYSSGPEPAEVPTGTGVPTEVASAVAVEPGELSLQRTASFGGADDVVADLLTSLQQAPIRPEGDYNCIGFGGAAIVPQYLVGLTYDDGTVWVAGMECLNASNGVVSSELDIRATVATALDGDPDVAVTGSAVPPSPPQTATAVAPPTSGNVEPGGSASGDPGSGDPGPGVATADPDDPFAPCVADPSATTGSADAFVPFTPTAVRICHATLDPSVAPPAPSDRPADVATALVGALAALPVLEPDVACTDIGGERWALLFTGAGGASELVTVDAGGCGTASNGLRIARADSGFFTRLGTLD